MGNENVTRCHDARIVVPQSPPHSREGFGGAALLIAAVVLVTPLRFSATAVLPSLVDRWSLSATGAAWITVSLQLGFVIGALAFAVSNLPDVVSPRWVFAICAWGGAVANALIAVEPIGVASAMILRFITGVSLAGVYPPALKIAAGLVNRRFRGRIMGLLVAAITLGSGVPYLLAGLVGGMRLPERPVLVILSVSASIGGLLVARGLSQGAYAPPSARFDSKQIVRVFRNRAMLLTHLGYYGHMWELYGLWAWVAIFLAQAPAVAAEADRRAPLFLAFGIVSIAGPIGSIAAGWLADRYGRTAVTIGAMAVSGACCLLSAFIFHASWVILVSVLVVWGVTAVADSAQFSAAVTELAQPEYIGTALTLQTCLGFALTMFPIWGLPLLADRVGWQFSFWALAPGPLLGCLAMAMLRYRPEAMRLADGRR